MMSIIFAVAAAAKTAGVAAIVAKILVPVGSVCIAAQPVVDACKEKKREKEEKKHGKS